MTQPYAPHGSAEPTASPGAIADRDFRGRLLVGDHILDLGALRLVSDPEVRVTRKAAAVMIHLARNQGRTVGRNELLDHVWAGTCPTPEVVTQAIMELRRVLGDDGRANMLIETVPRLGYRLVSPAVFQDTTPGAMGKRAVAPAALPEPDSAAPPATQAPIGESAEAGVDAVASPAAHTPAAAAPHQAGSSPIVVALLLALILLLVLIPKLMSLSGASTGAIASVAPIGPARVLPGASGTEFFPDLSPDGASVVYAAPDAAAGDVFKLFEKGIDSPAGRRITSDAVGEELLPSVAPDGRHIAYVRMHDGQCEVRIMQVPGGANRLAFDCAVDLPPYLEWSPDGTRLLSFGREPDKPRSVRLLEYVLDDGDMRWLDYPHGDQDIDVEPRYAPDGKSIAFRRGLRPHSSLMLLDTARRTVETILSGPAFIRGFDWLDAPPRLLASIEEQDVARLSVVDLDGRVTPSDVLAADYPRVRGKQVVFMRGVQRIGVATIDLDMTAPQRVFRALSVGANSHPVYSPDGEAIAFVSARAGDRRLCVLRNGSQTPKQMSLDFRGEVRSLAWSPDGTGLLLVTGPDPQSQIYIADVASGEVRQLHIGDAHPLDAAFDVDSDDLWFVAEHQGSHRLHRLLAPASASPRIVATEVLADQVQTRAGTEGVFVLDRCIVHLDSHLVRQRTYCPGGNVTAWRAGHDAIWSLRETGMRTASLHRFDLADGTQQVIGEYPLWWAGGTFDLAPDGSELLYAGFNADESDIAIAPVR